MDLFRVLIFFIASNITLTGFGQENELSVPVQFCESGTGLPLNRFQVQLTPLVFLLETDSLGVFKLSVPDLNAEIIVDLPGYNKRNLFINGRENLTLSLVSEVYRSMDNSYNNPLGTDVIKDAIFPVTSLTASDINFSKSSSFDQVCRGRVWGCVSIQQSD